MVDVYSEIDTVLAASITDYLDKFKAIRYIDRGLDESERKHILQVYTYDKLSVMANSAYAILPIMRSSKLVTVGDGVVTLRSEWINGLERVICNSMEPESLDALYRELGYLVVDLLNRKPI